MILRFKNISLTTRQSINLFITSLLLLPIYIDLMATLSEVLGFSTKGTTYFYYGTLWVLLLVSSGQILRAINNKVFLGAMVFLLIVIWEYILFPANRDFLLIPQLNDVILFAPKTLTAVVPYVLIGAAVTNVQHLKHCLHTGAKIGIVMGMCSYLLAVIYNLNIHYDDMNNAYALCVVMCILIADYQKKDGIYLIAAGLCLLLAGTRGPLVCVAVAIIIKTVFLELSMRKKVLRIMVGIFMIVLFQSELMVILVGILEKGFAAIGVHNLRIVEYFKKGMLLDTSGRDDILMVLIVKIWENPLLGYGVGADRLLSERNSYAHNLLFELWISYGIILGTAILCCMGYWIWKGIGSKDRSLASVATALFCGTVVKLFLSSSYLYSKELFTLLGICMAGINVQRSQVRRKLGDHYGRNKKITEANVFSTENEEAKSENCI